MIWVSYLDVCLTLLFVPLTVLFVGEQGGEHMMGGVFSTQVPGLLCGFYSKITIPESNLI